MGLFTWAEARTEVARLGPVLNELVIVRADAAELAAGLAPGGQATWLGGRPEWKAAEARLDELMTEVQQTGAELRDLAPLHVDFPADLRGVPVLLCWLEGEPDLAWYHRADIGFAGRRRLPHRGLSSTYRGGASGPGTRVLSVVKFPPSAVTRERAVLGRTPSHRRTAG